MKLLIDGRPIRQPISGSAVFVIELFKALKNININADVYLQSDKFRNKFIDIIPKNSAYISDSSKLIENLLFEYGLKEISNKNNNYELYHQTYFARLPLKNKKIITTIHDVIPLDFPHWFSWKNSLFARKNFHKQVLNSNICVFSSKFTEQRAFYNGKINCDTFVIPLAVSNEIHSLKGTYVNYFNANSLKIINNKNVHSGGYILMVGNIEPRKNINFVAKALKIFNDKFNLNLELVLAGRGNFKTNQILQETHKILGKPPIVLGFVSDSDKYWLYQNCALHIFASSYEGFGLPPVESIVIGSPTLIAANSSLDEIIPSKLFSFITDDIDSLVHSMESSIFINSHSLMKDKIESYLNYYKWNRVAADYKILYNKIL